MSPRVDRIWLAPCAFWLGCCAVLLPAHSMPAQPRLVVLTNSAVHFQIGWNDQGPAKAYTVQYRDGLGTRFG